MSNGRKNTRDFVVRAKGSKVESIVSARSHFGALALYAHEKGLSEVVGYVRQSGTAKEHKIHLEYSGTDSPIFECFLFTFTRLGFDDGKDLKNVKNDKGKMLKKEIEIFPVFGRNAHVPSLRRARSVEEAIALQAIAEETTARQYRVGDVRYHAEIEVDDMFNTVYYRVSVV